MGSAIQGIANSVTNAGLNANNNFANGVSALGIGGTGAQVLNYPNQLVQAINPNNTLNALGMGAPSSPSAPGINPSLSQLQSSQQQYANQFTAQLPQMQQQMAQNLTQASNQQMNAQLQQNKNQNNARGLLYGGVNQGQQGQITAANQQQLAGSISGANANLQNAANTLNAQAESTGLGIQQTQQATQNQIYQNALSQLNSNNSITGSMLGTGLMAAMAFA